MLSLICPFERNKFQQKITAQTKSIYTSHSYIFQTMCFSSCFTTELDFHFNHYKLWKGRYLESAVSSTQQLTEACTGRTGLGSHQQTCCLSLTGILKAPDGTPFPAWLPLLQSTSSFGTNSFSQAMEVYFVLAHCS